MATLTQRAARSQLLDVYGELMAADVESDLLFHFDKALDSGAWTSATMLHRTIMIQVLYVMAKSGAGVDAVKVSRYLDAAVCRAIRSGEAHYQPLAKQLARGNKAVVIRSIKAWAKMAREYQHCKKVESMAVNKISIKWSKSRAEGTYGQPLVSGRSDVGTRSRAMGGNYSLIGEVVGDIVQADYQLALRKLPEGKFYGLTHRADGSVMIYGACGMNSVEKIVREGLGLDWQLEYNKRNNDERAVYIG